jgi:Anti-sigma-K factor rskA
VSDRPPDFDDIVGADVSAEERERMRTAHELLVRASPPPELSPELDAVPWPDEALAPLGLRRRGRERRRSWLALAAAAAAIALVAFVIGQGTGSKSTRFESLATKRMHGTSVVPRATATIEIGKRGSDGNWPMLIDVLNLPPAPEGGYYILWLSRDGKPIAPCGSFNTRAGFETVVRLSAAYPFHGFDGWIVTREVPGVQRRLRVMTT